MDKQEFTRITLSLTGKRRLLSACLMQGVQIRLLCYETGMIV